MYLAFIIRRILTTIPVLVMVSVIVFMLMRMLPGDVIDILIGQSQADVSDEVIAELRRQYKLDQPIFIQYFEWLGRIVVGDFGTSYRNHQPVSAVIFPRLLPTLQIGLIALTLSAVIAVPLGALSAVKPNSIWDKIGTAGTYIGASMPYFLIGGILIYFISLQFSLLPASGYVSPFEDLGESIKRTIMPSLTLSLSLTAILIRQSRASFSDILQHPYIRTARAKGLSESRVIIQHALKNALLPITTLLGLQLGVLFSGAVITETVFSVPGVGRLLVDSILGRDYPVVQALVLLIAVAVVLSTLLVDVIYGLLDPRASRGDGT